MRALTTLFVVCGDIENGGFEASMYNSSGDWMGEAIRGARLIGADGHADLLEEFLRFGMAGDPAMSGDAREARLEAMTDEEAEQLERLGDAFFDLPSLDDALTSYVERHGDEFFTD